MGIDSSSIGKYAGIGMQAGGALINASAARSGAKQQRNQLIYNAQVAEKNAQLSEMQAQDATQRGQDAVAQYSKQAASVFSSQRTALAANGVDLGEGSANEQLATTKFTAELDQNQIMDNALRQAWGYRTQKSNLLDSANASRSGAKNINPNMAGITSLITGATQVASNYYTGKKSGLF